MKEKEPWEFNSYAEWKSYNREQEERENRINMRYAIAAIILGTISLLISILKFATKNL